MSQLPKAYGVLERLPLELAYLKEVAWEGALLPDYDLTDDNPEYGDKVYVAIRENFAGLSQEETILELTRQRQAIWDWLEEDAHGKKAEDGALYFIYGLLKFPEAVFRRTPNPAGAVDAPIARLLAFERQRRRATDQRR